MRYLYTFGILCYGLAIRLASLFDKKAKLWVAGRRDIFQQIRNKLADNNSPVAWFHASSLGEFEQCRPVIDAFKKQYPDYKIFVTFFSPSGYEVRKNYPNADYVFYLPLDTMFNARKFVDMVNPKMAFFVKYDFWFNYMAVLDKRNIPTILFSSIFRPSQYFFAWYGKWFCRRLNAFDHLFVQNKESEKLLKEHGISQCTIAGDTRFDQVMAIAANVKQFPEVMRFVGQSKVLLAGSTWEPDERLLKSFADTYSSADIKFVIAPHEIHASRIDFLMKLFGNTCVKYSDIANISDLRDYKVLIIDNIGMLSSLYQYAYVAYIGGGFGKGIHNILEALAFGKPVCFGPKYQKFQEAKDIVNLNGGWSVGNEKSLNKALTDLFDSDELYNKASDVCMHYVQDNKGTSDTIINMVTKF
ncbi:MAG: 3-deoxy-D-manno-octulosonic acid transferase [Bacteroidales bacterium]|nr:3-deoxy-D-manno-octulosonic acid transferase [Bacteroidales bacterium]